MKTKEELQAAVNDIRRVCEAHGVVLVSKLSISHGAIIAVHDAEAVAEDPRSLYKYGAYMPGNASNELKLLNKLIEIPYATNHEGEDQAVLGLMGIADVEGHTKPLIIVHQHMDGLGEMNVAKTVCVDSLDEVEEVPFIKHWINDPQFSHFECGVGDGPFGTLIAHWKSAIGKHSPAGVVGFIEGLSPEVLVAKWPKKEQAE